MVKFLDTLEHRFNQLIEFFAAMVAVSIGLFAVLIPLNLLLIKMEWGSFWWLYEGVEYALYVGVFIGAPWVLKKGAHVRVDVIVVALSAKLAVQLERLLNVVGATLCLVLCIYGTRAALWEFEDGTLPDKDLRIANWYMLSVFAISFFLLAVEFLFRLRRAEMIIKEKASSPSEAGF